MPNREEPVAAANGWREWLPLLESDFVAKEIQRCARLAVARDALSRPSAFRKLCLELGFRPAEVTKRIAVGRKGYLLLPWSKQLPTALQSWYLLSRLEDSEFLELMTTGQIQSCSRAREVEQ